MSTSPAPLTGDPSPAAGRAAAFALGWAHWYTARVGSEAGDRRRAEIESDVWEHRAAAAGSDADVGAAIALRVVAGMPADLSWMRHQRAIARGVAKQEKEFAMNTVTRVIARWWWNAIAVGLAVFYVVVAAGNLAQPGMPYLDGAVLALVCAALILVGTVVRLRWPVAGGLLVAAGVGPSALLWWAPILATLGVVVLIGVVLDLVVIPAALHRITAGIAAARALAIVGVIAATVAPLALGVQPGVIVTALVAVALAVAAIVRRRTGTPGVGSTGAGPTGAGPTGAVAT